MTISILGTGSVGQTLAEKIATNGHSVIIGTRNVEETLAKEGSKIPALLAAHSIQLKTFNDAAKDASMIINALNGGITLSVFQAINQEHLAGKIVLDVSNPLDFSQGFPPRLIEGMNNSSSLGESIQALIPNAKVVKSLNTMWGGLMLSPTMINNGEHLNFISGNDADAKSQVTDFLASFGWDKNNMIDLGDISNARGTEAYLLLWTRIYAATNNGAFNIQLVK